MKSIKCMMGIHKDVKIMDKDFGGGWIKDYQCSRCKRILRVKLNPFFGIIKWKVK